MYVCVYMYRLYYIYLYTEHMMTYVHKYLKDQNNNIFLVLCASYI